MSFIQFLVLFGLALVGLVVYAAGVGNTKPGFGPTRAMLTAQAAGIVMMIAPWLVILAAIIREVFFA